MNINIYARKNSRGMEGECIKGEKIGVVIGGDCRGAF